MNIFYLDDDPETAAKYHVDKHVIKMILESAQMLSTAVRDLAGTPTLAVVPYRERTKEKIFKLLDNETVNVDGRIDNSILYMSSFRHHPCNKWLLESFTNCEYLYNLCINLNKEKIRRFGRPADHKSMSVIHQAMTMFPSSFTSNKGLTKAKLAMPDECKIINDPVQSYRNYYITHKRHLATWTLQERPSWYV